MSVIDQQSAVDLRDFTYMPLHIARLQKSKAWLECKRFPELAFYLMNLWMRAWHEVPAGSIEDDDDVLADAAMCPMPRWMKIKNHVLRNWEKKEDGRLYHSTVTEIAADSWQAKIKQRNRTAAARVAKLSQRQSQTGDRTPTETVTISVTESVTDNVTASKGSIREEKEREERKEDKTADAVSLVKKYAFEGGIIKLSQKHFDDWTKAYAPIDLLAELTARDAWLGSDRATDADRKNWFISTSKYLANQCKEMRAKIATAPKQAAGGWA